MYSFENNVFFIEGNFHAKHHNQSTFEHDFNLRSSIEELMRKFDPDKKSKFCNIIKCHKWMKYIKFIILVAFMYSGGHLRRATSIEIVPKKKLILDGHHCT